MGVRDREEKREGGRSGEEMRPEPNWFVMPDMPMTILTWTASTSFFLSL